MAELSRILQAVRAKQRPMVLIASLPCNDPDLVKACLNGGADVIKVHINLNHRASASALGTLAQERHNLEKILELCKDIPCGIVPGDDPTKIDPNEMLELFSMGFDFISLYLHDTPVGVLPPSNALERMLALSSSDSLEMAKSIDSLDIQVLEASIMAKETYGQPLTYRDLALYRQLRQDTTLPIVVPSQHAFTPNGLHEISLIGVEAVMLGTIVTGKTPESWQNTFRKFKVQSEIEFSLQQNLSSAK